MARTEKCQVIFNVSKEPHAAGDVSQVSAIKLWIKRKKVVK